MTHSAHTENKARAGAPGSFRADHSAYDEEPDEDVAVVVGGVVVAIVVVLLAAAWRWL